MSYIDDYIPHCSEFEGQIPWLYLDTRGNVTVATGCMLPTLGSTLTLPFKNEDGSPTSLNDIQAAREKVAVMDIGKAAKAYRFDGAPTLDTAEMDAMLSKTLEGIDADLNDKLPWFEEAPDSVKMALLDMAFNLGESGLLNGYPKMLKACANGDWSGAAAECHRQGIPDSRNNWTYEQFEDAANA